MTVLDARAKRCDVWCQRGHPLALVFVRGVGLPDDISLADLDLRVWAQAEVDGQLGDVVHSAAQFSAEIDADDAEGIGIVARFTAAQLAGVVNGATWIAIENVATDELLAVGRLRATNEGAGARTVTIPLGPSAAGISLELYALPDGPTGGAELSDEDPQALGTAGPGTAELASRADHTHPLPSAEDVGAATPADVTAAIDALLAGAPGALDTLNELAAALGDDANFAATVAAALAGKATPADIAEAIAEQHPDPPVLDSIPGAGPMILGTDALDGTATFVSVLVPMTGEAGNGVSVPADWLGRVTVPAGVLAGLLQSFFPTGATALIPGPAARAGVYTISSADGTTVDWTEIPYPTGSWASADIPLSATTTYPWIGLYNGEVWRTQEPNLPALRGIPERGELLDTFTSGPAMVVEYTGPGGFDTDAWVSNDPSVALPNGLDLRYDVRFLPGILGDEGNTDFYHQVLAILDPSSSGGDLLELAGTHDDGTQLTIPPDRLGTFTELRPDGAPGEVPQWVDLLWRLGARIKGRTVWDVPNGEVRHYARAYMISDDQTDDGRRWRLLYRSPIDPSIHDATGLTWHIGGQGHFQLFEFQAFHGVDGTPLVNIDSASLAAAVGTTTITCQEGTEWTTTNGQVLASAGALHADQVTYDPGDPSNWTSTPPKLLAEAVDRIADAIGPIA